jgi:hypothetical protein
MKRIGTMLSVVVGATVLIGCNGKAAEEKRTADDRRAKQMARVQAGPAIEKRIELPGGDGTLYVITLPGQHALFDRRCLLYVSPDKKSAIHCEGSDGD